MPLNMLGLDSSSRKAQFSQLNNFSFYDSFDESRTVYDSIAGVGKTGVWLRADFQSGSRVLKKVF